MSGSIVHSGEVVNVDEHHIPVTVSIGATSATGDPGFDQLVDQARAAMMSGSDRGGSTMQIFQPYLVNAFRTKLELEADLRRAFSARGFQLFFQPQIEIASGCITGVEALLRWPRSEDSYVSPAEFIPAAERIGLIHDVGLWVLETAMRQLLAWAEMDLSPYEMAVNVSPLQLKDDSFVDKVADVLERTGLSPDRLVLEITESVAIEQEGEIEHCLDGLQDVGVKLAIDDFGSGYANLSSLTRLPFTKLKIDRSLLPKSDDERSRTLFSRVVTMSQELGFSTVAEGVETNSELLTVHDAGCPIVQGFLYARPAMPEHLESLLADGVRVEGVPRQTALLLRPLKDAANH